MVSVICGSESKSSTSTGKNSIKRLKRKFKSKFSAPLPPPGKNPGSSIDARTMTEEDGSRDAVKKWRDSVTVAGMERSGSGRKRGHYF
jgi:hypothetical protein